MNHAKYRVWIWVMVLVLAIAGVMWYLMVKEKREPVTDGTLVQRELDRQTESGTGSGAETEIRSAVKTVVGEELT